MLKPMPCTTSVMLKPMPRDVSPCFQGTYGQTFRRLMLCMAAALQKMAREPVRGYHMTFIKSSKAVALGKANPMVQFMPEEAISWVEMKESMRTFDLQKEELPEAITVA